MRPVSDLFLQTLRGSHEPICRVRVVNGNPTGTDPDGEEIEVESGTVKLDANAEVRGTLDLTTPGADRWPSRSSDLLTPYGPELFVECGLRFGDGTREWVSQGYYRVEDLEQDQVPDGLISVSGLDRMAGIRDARLTEPVVFAAGSSVELVFESLVLEVYPTVEIVFDFDAAGSVFDTMHVAEEDRYRFLYDVARSRGKIMYFDYAGRLQVCTSPEDADPVWEVDAGHHGVLISLARSLSRAGAYNAVVVTGEAPGEGDPVRAVARDLNPDSPTYWAGRFGKVPRFYASSFITTVEQAATTAESMLRRAVGLPYNVDLHNIPNPALEPLDPILVTFPDRSERHVIESVGLGLTAREDMTLTTREQTVVLIEVGN